MQTKLLDAPLMNLLVKKKYVESKIIFFCK